MSSLRKLAKHLAAAFATIALYGVISAQDPICSVLLRPAFHYTTDGLTVILADSSTTFGQNATASFSFGDGTSPTTDNAHQFQEPGNYTVCLTLSTPTLNCSATFCRQVTVPMTSCGGINAFFTLSDAGTNSLQFSDVSLGSFAGDRLWEFGDGYSSTEEFPTHTWLLPGPHFVSLTRTQGQCSVTYGRWIEVDGNASTCGQDLFVDFEPAQEGLSATFQPTIIPNNVIPVVEIWSYGDGDVDTVLTGSNEFPMSGNYQTCLLVGAIRPPAMDTCFSLVCHTVDVMPLAGVEEIPVAPLRIWPNPFTSVVFVSVDPGAERISMLDPLGRVVATTAVTTHGNFMLDGQVLSTGSYFIEVTSAGGIRRSPIIKLE